MNSCPVGPEIPPAGRPDPLEEAFFLDSLRQVSRTFDFCIRVLPTRLRRPIALAYLLCRIADTVEDEPSAPPGRKAEALAGFRKALATPEPDGSLEDFLEGFFRSIPRDTPDVRLGRESRRVLAGLRRLPRAQREAVVPWVSELASGMAEYSTRAPGPDGVLALKDMEDLDNYCYYVAGTVGRMLTELFILDLGLSGERAAALRSRAVPFGQGLQLVNILKDVRPDSRRARCFLPASVLAAAGVAPGALSAATDAAALRRAIIPVAAKAFDRLRTALDYLLLLPRTAPRIRLFCAWPLFMAVETLPVCLARPAEGPDASDVSLKITRTDVKRIRRQAMLRVFSNGMLRRHFERSAGPLKAMMENPEPEPGLC